MCYQYIKKRLACKTVNGVLSISGVPRKTLKKWDRLAQKYVLIEDVLYRRREPYHPLRVPRIVEREDLLRKAHDLNGHFGTETTKAHLMREVYWENIHNSVETYISSCQSCQYHRPKENVEELHPIQPLGSFGFWSLDFVGPLVETPRENKYFITAIEHSTRYLVAESTTEQNAEEVKKILLKISFQFGIPSTILTDQGSPFKNADVAALCKELSIRHRMSTAYHPETNGLVERYNGIVLQRLKRFCMAKEDQWDNLLQLAVFNINSRKQSSLAYSPFYLVYGRQPRLIGDSSETGEATEIDHDMYSQQLKEAGLAKENAIQRLNAAQEKIKMYHDRKLAKKDSLTVGDLVLLADPIQRHKLAPKWLGPYKIIFSFNGVTFVLQAPDGRIVRSAHRDQLCKYTARRIEPIKIPSKILDTYLEAKMQDENVVLRKSTEDLMDVDWQAGASAVDKEE